jgi:hypothetical protein
MRTQQAKNIAWACLLSTFVAAGSVVFADGVYLSDAGFRRWCETASNAAYILAGCWRY